LDAQPSDDQRAAEAAGEKLRGLMPVAESASAGEVVERLGLWQRPLAGAAPGRPHVILNMISTADGRATIGGRSGSISGPADRGLFHALRAPADAIMVGASTVRIERYGRLISDASRRQLRERRGLLPEPLAVIVTRSLKLDPTTPLLAEPASRVVVLTPSPGEIPPTAAQVEYVRTEQDGVLDLGLAFAQLHERYGVGLLLCEGGPHLAGELLAAGLLHELFLTIAPRLAGGDPPAASAPRILAGGELEPTVELALAGVLEADSHLFLRYVVVAPERVSRETMLSSSLAS
jgi:riboflavin biosynthesis pyrimidine reductase